MRLILLSTIVSIIIVTTFVWWISHEPHSDFHMKVMEPGKLSSAHASLESTCSQCHTPIKGVEAQSCISCHATEKTLLARQPTAFHSSISTCIGCHVEHEGRAGRITLMDHEILVKAGLKNQGQTESEKLISWLHRSSPNTQTLNCNSCHANQDKHLKLFGTECADCHGVKTWKIDSYKHPSPGSTDCAQCHQGPPSHYMMHFEMISKKVAGIEHAEVRQCYLCHQTTSWNDIKGVGWYKHH